MLYDGIAAESAHVSIDGRATASIIEEKKLPEWAASEAVFCQVSQLGEAGAGHARTQWHASAQHLDLYCRDLSAPRIPEDISGESRVTTQHVLSSCML